MRHFEQILSCCSTFAILSISLGGMARADDLESMGPLRVSQANPRYFTDGSGRVIYLTGSHTWLNFQDGSSREFDYDEFLDFLQHYNHNFLRLWAWESVSWILPDSSQVLLNPLPFKRTGPGQALDGKPKFDLNKFNQGYFHRLRQRVVAARDRELYVGVMLFQGFSVSRKSRKRKTSPWLGHPFHKENNINDIDGDANSDGEGYEVHTLMIPEVTRIQEAYIRKAIDTVNDLDNVIYEISNESHGDSTRWQHHMIEFIHDYERTKPKQHPVWMSFQWDGIDGSGTNAHLFDSSAEAVSPAGDARDLHRSNPPLADGSKVVISDTDHLWGIGGNASWVWKSFLQGLNPIFMDTYKESPHNMAPEMDLQWESIREAMGYTLIYSKKMNLMDMAPHGDLTSTGYCLANPGKEYLVYQPESDQPFQVTLQPDTYYYEWFNPKTGEMGGKGKISVGNASQTFVTTFGNGAVLYLKVVE